MKKILVFAMAVMAMFSAVPAYAVEEEVTLDKYEVYCSQGISENIVCYNLVDGSTYKITFRLEDSELRVGVSTVQ